MKDFLIGTVFGITLMTIILNISAHSEIKENPQMTLSEYWDGK